MPTESDALVDADQAAFMQRGVSITVGACNAANMPSLVRAVGCRVSPDLRRVTVFVSKSQASVLLHDIHSNGKIAVVFSEPSTHRTMQLKGSDALVGALDEGDFALIAEHEDAFVQELEPIGFRESVVRTLLAYVPDDMVGITFTPSAAFSQTPGPGAGEPLRAGA